MTSLTELYEGRGFLKKLRRKSKKKKSAKALAAWIKRKAKGDEEMKKKSMPLREAFVVREAFGRLDAKTEKMIADAGQEIIGVARTGGGMESVLDVLRELVLAVTHKTATTPTPPAVRPVASPK